MNVPADERDETARTRTIAGALIVGGSAEFVERCRTSLVAAGLTVWSCGSAALTTAARQHRPALIIVPERTFQADPVPYIEAARAVDGRVIPVGADVEVGDAVSRALSSARGSR